MIHREALSSKTLPINKKSVLQILIKMVNFTYFSAFMSRVEFYSQGPFYYTAVRWLSKGNVIARVLSLWMN